MSREGMIGGGTVSTSSTVPTSSGPAVVAATVILHAPASAARGTTITVTATMRTFARALRIITSPTSSAVLVVAAGRVVARTVGGRTSTLPVPVPLGRTGVRPLQVVPDTVALIGEPASERDTGESLPAGDYLLVAVLGYTTDSLNAADTGPVRTAGARVFHLVSDPVPLTIY